MVASIQIVDISTVTGAEVSLEEYLKVGEDLARSFEETGFVFVSGHGVPQNLIDETFKVSMDFFNLEDSEKILLEKGPDFQGYVPMGRETANYGQNITEMREAFDVRNISVQGKFPDSSYPKMRESFTNICKNFIAVSMTIQRCLSVALGLEVEHLNSMCQGLDMGQDGQTLKGFTQFRSLHYPAIPEQLYRSGEKLMRVSEHTDFGFITLLCQDETGGPEVQTNEGQWIYAEYKPGCILVNIGDLLENLCGGRFKATNHKITIPEDISLRSRKRQSLIFFVMPDHHTPIKPLTGPNPLSYQATTSIKHTVDKFKKLNGDAYGFEEEINGQEPEDTNETGA